MDRNEEKLYEIFREMEITDYTVTEHEAIMSIEEADQFGLVMEGLNVKNLFIK